MRDLLEIREEIDQIDQKIIRLYEKRKALTTEVAEYKVRTNKQVLDKKREKEKLAEIEKSIDNVDVKKDAVQLFEKIMSMSRRSQYKMLLENGKISNADFLEVDRLDKTNIKIVYQGTNGAYTQIAMHAYFGQDINSYSVETWKDAMEDIKNGNADFAVLPIENSSAGIVSENYDLLVEYDCYIVGEQTLNIEHSLLGIKGSTLEDIDCVYSHPQALMQCRDFLDEHDDWKKYSSKNTAISAKKILEDGLINQAAIASNMTADIYGLNVLKKGINFSNVNSTKFIIITKNKICLKGANKISICFEVPHESGSLYNMLSHFINNNLNMNKIESRPIKDKRFEYRFFIDFEGNLKDGAVLNTLYGLKEEALNLKILGNY